MHFRRNECQLEKMFLTAPRFTVIDDLSLIVHAMNAQICTEKRITF